jgi:hypothetical protein
VEEISLARFTGGNPTWVRFDATPNFDRREVILRARSRLGEDSYRLLTNNCEHFCEWCLWDERRSYQVEAWLACPGRALHAMIHFIAQVLPRWDDSVCVLPGLSLRTPVENPRYCRRRQKYLSKRSFCGQ